MVTSSRPNRHFFKHKGRKGNRNVRKGALEIHHAANLSKLVQHPQTNPKKSLFRPETKTATRYLCSQFDFIVSDLADNQNRLGINMVMTAVVDGFSPLHTNHLRTLMLYSRSLLNLIRNVSKLNQI